MGRGCRFLTLLYVCVLVGCAYDIPYEDTEEESPQPSGDTSPTPTAEPTPPGASFVFSSDFETDEGGFVVQDNNSNSTWEWGAPTNGPGGAASGTNVWATNLGGRYQDFDDSCIVSPDITLPSTGTIELRFQLAVETEQGYDYWRVEIADQASSDQLDGGSGGNSNNYSAESYDISEWFDHTVQIRFCLETDEGVRDDGLYVDDVGILVY